MTKQKVAFCIAKNKWQEADWWQALVVAATDAVEDPEIDMVGLFVNGSAQPDFNKNNAAASVLNARRVELTDTARNDVVEQVDASAADWLYWWDDDTIHPRYTLKRLLALQRPFVSGVYHVKNEPYVPIAYFRNEGGTYRPMLKYQRGELVTVDFVGMGCALIHKQVYADIRANHTVLKTERGSYMVVQNSQMYNDEIDSLDEGVFTGSDGNQYYMQPVRVVDDEEQIITKLQFPYYGMEVTRTEDIWFCQLAEHVGYKPTVDTDITCDHLGSIRIGRDSFRRYQFVPKEEADEQAQAAANS